MEGAKKEVQWCGMDKSGWGKVNGLLRPAVLELALRRQWQEVVTSKTHSSRVRN